MEACCHISLEAIAQNYLYFQERMSPAKVIPVVKANAYGHGAVPVVGFLMERFSPELFAVATLEEAVELSNIYPEINVLIFSRVFTDELSAVPTNAILSIGSMEDALALKRADPKGLKVHLNINTGMNRLGLTPGEGLQLLEDQARQLQIVGLYSHFSSSDTNSERVYEKQRSNFDTFVQAAYAHGFSGMVHLANSAAALHNLPPRYDAMRLGIGLYGYDTTPDALFQASLAPAMEIQAPLVRVEQIEVGASVSYGEKWTAAQPTTIGTLRIGYADGYNRLLSNRGQVCYGPQVFPVIGTVTMDHIMIDLGQVEFKPGTQFTIMGGANPANTITGIAHQLNSIPYEICCAISARVKRVYH